MRRCSGRFAVLAAIAASAPACETPPAEPSAGLLEAVDWYTGVAGRVDDGRARAMLADAAEGGNPIALMWLARAHSRGRMKLARDSVRAARLAESAIGEVERAAEAAVLEAVFLMGTAYDEGLGKPADPVAAAAWHRRAAERGHVLGAHNLGNAYAEGRGVRRDMVQAVRWWTLAAERGDAIAQLRLGEALEAGRGAPAGLEAALAWYRKAALSGNVEAWAALKRLGR